MIDIGLWATSLPLTRCSQCPPPRDGIRHAVDFESRFRAVIIYATPRAQRTGSMEPEESSTSFILGANRHRLYTLAERGRIRTNTISNGVFCSTMRLEVRIARNRRL